MFAAKDTLFTRPSGYQISRSVRLRSSASAYLNRTPASATNRRTFTWSGWVKRGASGDGTGSNHFFLFTAGTSTAFCAVDFYQNNIRLNFGNGTYLLVTSSVYRDYSSWYHIVVSVDTTQTTDTNRVKLYINGTQVTAFSTASYPIQNYDTAYNNTVAQRIAFDGGSNYFDGYLTEVNFIDGQALTPSSFGETNAITGVWQPKKYAGTYGTNGFYLNFSDNSGATATTIGKDYSGNGNNWTPNNISVTAGVTYDSMLDVPTLYADGGNGRGNYAVMNPNDQAGGLVVADGNLKVTAATGWDGARATFSLPSTGKWYWEALCIARSTGASVGILGTSAVITGDLGAAATGYVYNSGDGNKYNNGSGSAYGATWGTNDIIGIAWDADTGTLSFYKNGTSQGTAYSSLTGQFSPAIGVNGSDSMAANFGQRPFSYTPPTGFVALNTQNLPAPTISNGANYMAANLFTGNSATQTVNNAVNGVSFQPDLVWFKSRSGVYDHAWLDSVRGGTPPLFISSNTTTAEGSTGGGESMTYNSNGFSVVSNNQRINVSGSTYVAWQWNAGGSTVTNTSGSISAQVRANPTAGFSVVTYTGTGNNLTVGHGLGVAPSMVIFKNRGASAYWAVYHSALGSSKKIYLNDTQAPDTATNWCVPNSTTLAINDSSNNVNAVSNTYVAYVFSAVAGYSAFGKYTGNGSTDGPFVFLGFRPRFVMIKGSSDADRAWVMLDTSRNTANVMNLNLYANASDAEATDTRADILSNGFKVRATGTWVNNNASTYIYMAFAENPLKLSLAR